MKYFLYIILFFNAFTLQPIFAQESSPFRMAQKPYLQALTDSSVSILWTTNRPAVAWVELAPDDGTHFYEQEREKIHDSRYGFKQISTLHRVDLKGLKPGTKYRYRVYAQEVLKHEDIFVYYGRTVANDVFKKQPYSFQTASSKDTVNFFVVNDIHGNNELLRKLAKQQDMSKIDFAVLNGDMIDLLLSEQQMFDGFLTTTIDILGGGIPFYYSRGNHETRGPFAFSYPKFFPTNNNQLYYTFSYGDAFFIVLDSGEDKPDSDIEYGGLTDMDKYRTEQAAWLERVVNSENYKKAKYKIAISHMPPFGDWHGVRDLEKKFVPILNKAGIQLMLSGHYHSHIYKKPDSTRNFPVLINSNLNIIKAAICKEKIDLLVLNEFGKTIEHIIID